MRPDLARRVVYLGRPTPAFQPRRFRMAPSAAGCKRWFGGVLRHHDFLGWNPIDPLAPAFGLMRSSNMVRTPSTLMSNNARSQYGSLE
jgi:hypothetical protein